MQGTVFQPRQRSLSEEEDGALEEVVNAHVSWPRPDELDDASLDAAPYPPTLPSRVRRPESGWARVHRELARHEDLTLQLLWLEYREAHPDGYQYSRFSARYREGHGRLDVVMRQVHRAGEKAFVDYAGLMVEVTDRPTGKVHCPAEIALGPSEGGGGCPERGVMGSGAAAQPSLLFAVGGARGDRASAGGVQRATVPEDLGQPQLLRGSAPFGAQTAPGRALRLRRVAQGSRDIAHHIQVDGPLLQLVP